MEVKADCRYASVPCKLELLLPPDGILESQGLYLSAKGGDFVVLRGDVRYALGAMGCRFEAVLESTFIPKPCVFPSGSAGNDHSLLHLHDAKAGVPGIVPMFWISGFSPRKAGRRLPLTAAMSPLFMSE